MRQQTLKNELTLYLSERCQNAFLLQYTSNIAVPMIWQIFHNYDASVSPQARSYLKQKQYLIFPTSYACKSFNYMKSINFLKPYLYGKNFIVVTDHRIFFSCLTIKIPSQVSHAYAQTSSATISALYIENAQLISMIMHFKE